MELAFAGIVAVLIGVLLLKLARRSDARARQGAHRLARNPLPSTTLLPRGNVSYPRLIERTPHGGGPVAGDRPVASAPLNRGRTRIAATLLALALALLLLLLLLAGGNDEEKSRVDRRAPADRRAGLPGVGMPGVLPGNVRVKPLRIAVAFDGTYGPRARRRELRALGAWLDSNHNPRTRVTVVDEARGRASRPARASELGGARLVRRGRPARAFLRRDLGRGRHRLLVTTGTRDRATARRAAVLRVHPRRGARLPADVHLSRTGRRVVDVDPRRRNALAATVARAIITVSGMRERR